MDAGGQLLPIPWTCGAEDTAAVAAATACKEIPERAPNADHGPLGLGIWGTMALGSDPWYREECCRLCGVVAPVRDAGVRSDWWPGESLLLTGRRLS